jgi:hypothetical protein
MAQFNVEPVFFHVPSGEIKASLLGENPSYNPLAVVMPGAGYSCKQPLLYFLVKALLASSYQVLTIDSLYADDKKWLALPSEMDAYRYVQNDAESLFQQIQSRFKKGVHTIVARSLGTYAIACALEKDLIHPAQIVWQCPSLHDKWAILQNSQTRGLVIIGDADPRYELAASYLPEDSFVARGADHAMEVSDPIQSINLLKQITEHTQNWLQDSDVDMSQLDRNSRLTPDQRLVEHQAALELCDELARAGARIHEQSE